MLVCYKKVVIFFFKVFYFFCSIPILGYFSEFFPFQETPKITNKTKEKNHFQTQSNPRTRQHQIEKTRNNKINKIKPFQPNNNNSTSIKDDSNV